MSFTNEEFIELVRDFLRELRPETPVNVGLGRVEKEGQAAQEFLYIRQEQVNGRGPVTEVRFKKSDLVGLSEAHIKVFLTGKLSAIGIAIAEERERAAVNMGETAQEFDGSASAEEIAQLRAMSQRRNIAAPGQDAAQAKVEQQLKADPSNVTQADLDALNGVI